MALAGLVKQYEVGRKRRKRKKENRRKEQEKEEKIMNMIEMCIVVSYEGAAS